MMHDLSAIQTSFQEATAGIVSLQTLESVRIAYLGRKGALAAVFDALKNLPPDERREAGEKANALRREIEQALAEKKSVLERTEHESILKKEWLDVTRPGVKPLRGHLHPLTKITRDIVAIFSSMGFAVAEGPEAETEHYNFDALNIPADHPARDMWDTFWLQSSQKEITNHKLQIPNKSQKSNPKSRKLLLRTHTSPVQIRYMETHQPPIRIIVPGRVYRYEATDASHDVQFMQVEGLMADTNVSVANFKAVIQMFLSRLFHTQIEIRLRPSYFPFTEPSFEVDISCTYCRQKGCSICKQSGWLELMGAGMVHPRVFKAAGWNPKNIAGFAFGVGIDRLALMKYKIPDIRLFRSGDLRFLKQF
ncbi:MAG: phenylalanine--tRNA ligase subunit alpha [Patescibacteria group bacterium]